MPKPLLTLSGRPGDERLLDFHLTAVAKAGARAVVIVGSREVTRAPLRSILTLGPGVEVRMVESTAAVGEGGTAGSLALALDEAKDLTTNKRLVVVQAGVVYSPSVLARLAASDESRTAMVMAPTGTIGLWTDTAAPTEVLRMGRSLEGTPAVEGLVLRGASAGVWSVARTDVDRLRQALRWALTHSSGGPRARSEEALQMLAERGFVDAQALAPIDTFQTVDTPDDYARLNAEVWPALQAARG